tara:strand:+ start:9984 stop:11906 length:1923 start_codon:yes stop_codon:yes gene_type:complete
MSRSLLDDVLSCPTLPSLPAVAVEILELTGDPNVPMKKIAQAVQRDQALSGKVLKTVNSSFYGLSTPCGSIDRAMAFLGLNTVKSLVLGFSLVDVTTMAGAERFNLMAHWRRAITGAVSARHVAVMTHAADPDEAFTAGLFQDVGALACVVFLKGEYADAVGELEHAKWETAERETFGFSHAEVGEGLCRKWKLPAPIVAAIAGHHSPGRADPAHADLTRVVALGAMVGSVLANESPVPTLKQIAARCTEWFGDAAPDPETLIERSSEDARVIAKLFAQDIGHMPDTRALLAEAQEKGLEHQLEQQRHAEELAKEATTDRLTGLANRRRFDLDLEKAFAAYQESGQVMSVIFSDADRFKSVNDTHGHAAGDAVLVELARRMSETVGDMGTVARYGGEEIAVILPGVGIDDAAVLGERIRADIAAKPFDVSGVECDVDLLNVTVSVGVTATDADRAGRYSAVSQLVNDADACVYDAKRAGRNRVFVHRPADSSRLGEPAKATGATPGTVRVLFVEDDPLAATLITTLLKRQKAVQIEWIESGTRAAGEIQRMIDGEIPAADVFLIDLKLPGSSGYDLLKMVRACPLLEHATVLVLSGEPEPSARGECMKLGATDFIPKQQFVADIGRWVGTIVNCKGKAAA